ncbi:MAG: RNA polymerase sigma factor [Acidobacteria bacterium]|nr:RNA polymerase sigma factor [Acidobacteriota bacterium]
MSDGRTEAELLEQACRGDESAFRAVYERHRDCVFRFAYRMLGSVAAAEDITHDCFLSLLRKPQLFDPDRASLKTYLCAAARNLVWKQLRRRGLETDVEEVDETRDAVWQNGPYEQLRSSEIAEGVRQAIASLPPLQREAVILFEFEELSLSEAAAAAQTDIGTIKSRLHRARQRLRGLLAVWIAPGENTPLEEIKP